MSVVGLIREDLMTSPEGDEFVEKVRERLDEHDERIEQIEEDLDGDDRGRFPGLRKEIGELRAEQNTQRDLIDAWELSEEKRQWSQDRRDRFNRLFIAGLSILSTLLSMLVAANTLAGG